MTGSRVGTIRSLRMTVGSIVSRAKSLKSRDLAMSVWVFFTFAVAQPILDLLGRNPEFFLARAAPGWDIVAVALLLLVAVPGVLVLAVLGARAIHPLTGVVMHWVVSMATLGVLVIGIIARTPASSAAGWRQLVAAGFFALAGWLIYVRFRPVRATVRYASLGTVVFLITFLLLSPTGTLLRASGSVDSPTGVTVGNPAPVVMIVFDEFPVASLIDSQGNIIEETFPNFARLSRDGIWFRNAMAVEQQTEEAIPTILGGRHPSDRDAIPIAADYPLTLFSLLSGSHEIVAVESVTELCPEYACSNRSRLSTPLWERWRNTGEDLSIVAAHTTFPSEYTASLPSIANTWGNFGQEDERVREEFNLISRFNEHVSADRRTEVARFLQLLAEPSNQPMLHFAHFLLPHLPWSYLDNGQQYRTLGRAPGSTSTGWESDEWLVMQAYQRHLIQVAYTDTIVGEVIEALERAGTYDESLIVVLADHGNADIPEVEHRRVITEDTVGHIAAIPLFVKLPDMERTGVDDYRAETTDVLPTIADVLDVDILWGVDGTSLLSPVRPVRDSTTMQGSRGPVTFGVDGSEKLAVARWKESWFFSGDPFSLAPPGTADLLGEPLDGLPVVADDALTIRLDHPEWYENVALDAEPFPAQITGTLEGQLSRITDVILGVGINGRIETVVRSYREEGETRFQAMVPRSSLREGANDVDVIVVSGSAAERKIVKPSGP